MTPATIDRMAALLVSAGIKRASHDAMWMDRRPVYKAHAERIAHICPHRLTVQAVISIQREIFADMFPRRTSE